MPQSGKFGKYEIIRKLSRSMTDVYLAREGAAGRAVVLKLIEESGDDFTRLAIEAETRGAQLQKQMHTLDPRILDVYEFGQQENCFFVALEYFEGQTLTELLSKDRRLNPKRAAVYAAEICSQLTTLHSFVSDVNGRRTAVVHGDVKPSNVQIGAGDELKLLDFGIAKMITATHNLTRHNLGSPSYCSPERLSSSQVDVHSDLWAVGVTLFEMLSGSPPYQAQDTRRLEQVIQSRRPPRALPADIPAPLQSIVAKALAGDINHRYHSASEFERDLRAYLEQRAPSAANGKIVWTANETVEKARPAGPKPSSNPTKLVSRPAIKQIRLKPRALGMEFGNLTIALLAGLLAGLLMLLPVIYYYRIEKATGPLRSKRDYAHDPAQTLISDWALYQGLKNRDGWLGPFSPMVISKTAFRDNLIASGENILDGYRTSSDTRLSDFDWNRAAQCLRHALEIDPGDTKLKGTLAIAEGYLNMVKNPRPPRASLSIDNFRQGASYLPKSPDPHLGLARLYVYAFRNIGEAMPEFQQAQRLGYQLGPRETTQEADGYLYRSQWELARARKASTSSHEQAQKWLDMSRADAERARGLYEPLVGYSNVSANLEQIYEDRAEQDRIASVGNQTGFKKWQ